MSLLLDAIKHLEDRKTPPLRRPVRVVSLDDPSPSGRRWPDEVGTDEGALYPVEPTTAERHEIVTPRDTVEQHVVEQAATHPHPAFGHPLPVGEELEATPDFAFHDDRETAELIAARHPRGCVLAVCGVDTNATHVARRLFDALQQLGGETLFFDRGNRQEFAPRRDRRVIVDLGDAQDRSAARLLPHVTEAYIVVALGQTSPAATRRLVKRLRAAGATNIACLVIAAAD